MMSHQFEKTDNTNEHLYKNNTKIVIDKKKNSATDFQPLWIKIMKN